ncbi:MAG TPA: enoyl-CoA hydratase/isomerase family protein [Spirochaetia bacterium]|nr:enoyl-CoA hydratase/isomerase family protein [Spirochaetia bacterium]
MARVEQYVDSQVAVITLNDGEHGNLLGPESLGELAAAVDRSVTNPGVRAVFLRSNGPSFCLGMDLAQLAAASPSTAETEAQRAASTYADILEGIFFAGLPFVCLVQGEVKAGGVGLACACDIVLGVQGTTFEMAEVLFGLIPANVLPYLLALRVPPLKVRYLVMSSKKITGEEAMRLNMVDEIVAHTEVETKLREIFKRLLRSSPRALADAKAFTSELIGKSPHEAGAIARRKLLSMLRDPSVTSGVKAFQEGGVPSWSSRFRPAAPLALDAKPKRSEAQQ